MTLRHRIRFYQQMAIMARAGVSIRSTLLRLKESTKEPAIATLSDQVNAGERIGEAFVAARFSSFECQLVAAGERSAQLDVVFEHLAEFWKRELEMRQALISPLYYPLVVLHLAVALGAGVELALVAWPIVLVHFIVRMAVLYVFGFVVFMLVRASWSSPALRGFWLWVPIIGNSLATACAYRWITALRLEFGAGISLARAVGDAWRASGYIGGDRVAEEGEEAMRRGVELSKLVREWRQLPRDWIDFIETGEISGAFEQAFANLEKEAARAWKLAQERMSEWVPRIVYFFVLILVAMQVGSVLYKVEIAPISDAMKQIDDATK